jgi:hypothetical protein
MWSQMEKDGFVHKSAQFVDRETPFAKIKWLFQADNTLDIFGQESGECLRESLGWHVSGETGKDVELLPTLFATEMLRPVIDSSAEVVIQRIIYPLCTSAIHRFEPSEKALEVVSDGLGLDVFVCVLGDVPIQFFYELIAIHPSQEEQSWEPQKHNLVIESSAPMAKFYENHGCLRQ